MALGSYFAWRCKAAPLWAAAENSCPAPLQSGIAAGKSPLGKAARAALSGQGHTAAAHKSRSSFRRDTG
jgi:hypothetical protein